MLCMYISYYLLLEKGAIDNNKKKRNREKKNPKTAFLIYAQNIVVWVYWFFSLIWLERLTRMQKVCVRIPVTTAKVV